MIIHKMKLAREPFEKVATGQKIIESRLLDDKRKLINIGDLIEFSQNENPNNKVTVKVEALYQYPSFSELFSNFPPEYFGGKSKESLLTEIEQFYSREEQEQLGVIGIKMTSC